MQMAVRKGLFLKLLVALVLLLAGLAIYLYWAGNVTGQVTASDRAAIAQVLPANACVDRSSFELELSCITELQARLKARVPNMQCAARGVPAEPASFLARGYGC